MAKKPQTQVYVSCKYPQAKNRDKMPIDEFIEIEHYPINRNHEDRAPKVTKMLISGKKKAKQGEVDLLYYTGETTSKPADFVKDTMYVLDGNTRQYIWKKAIKMNELCIRGSKVLLPIPEEVITNVYEMKDPYEIHELYSVIDSQSSAESSSEKQTGYFRAAGILGNLQNRKFKKGHCKMAIDMAVPLTGAIKFKHPKVTDKFQRTELLVDVIKQLDKLDAPGRGALSTQLVIGGIMLTGLLDPNNPRWIEAIIRLRDEVTKDPSGNKYEDGLSWIVEAQDFNISGDSKLDQALPLNKGLFNGRGDGMNWITKCLVSYMKGETLAVCPKHADLGNSYVDEIIKVSQKISIDE